MNNNQKQLPLSYEDYWRQWASADGHTAIAKLRLGVLAIKAGRLGDACTKAIIKAAENGQKA